MKASFVLVFLCIATNLFAKHHEKKSSQEIFEERLEKLKNTKGSELKEDWKDFRRFPAKKEEKKFSFGIDSELYKKRFQERMNQMIESHSLQNPKPFFNREEYGLGEKREDNKTIQTE